MFELSPTRTFRLDAPVRQIACGGFCYLITGEGSVYLYDEAPKLVAGPSGRLLQASPYSEGLVALFTDKEVVLRDFRGCELRGEVALGKADGAVASHSLVAAWYPGKSLLQSRVRVIGGGGECWLDAPRVLGAAVGGRSLYILTIDGGVTRIAFEGSGWAKRWTTRVGGGCERLLALERQLVVQCGSKAFLLDSESGGILRVLPLVGKKLALYETTLVNWDLEGPLVRLIDLESGEEREVALDPVYGVFAGRELVVLSRWKLTFITRDGDIADAVLLPLPLAENFAIRDGAFLFSIREWLVEAERREPAVSVRLVRVVKRRGVQEVEAEVKAARPSSLKPLEGARATIVLGGSTVTVTLDNRGVGRATFKIVPGLQRATVMLEDAISVGHTQLHKRVEVPRDVEVPVVPDVAQPSPGDLLAGKYVLQLQLGEGGFGAVYRARDMLTDRLVAVKVPHAYFAPEEVQGELVTEALKMAEASRRLNKEGRTVVEIFDAGVYMLEDISRREKGRVMAIIMEYCEGGSLRTLLDSGGVKEPFLLARKVGEKLSRLHREGVIHGDLKPENVLLSGGEVLLADFYTAAFLTRFDEVRRFRKLAFTEGYAPPELVERGEVSLKTDVYSFAAIIVEMLTGNLPAPDSLPMPLLEMGVKPSLLKLLEQALSSNPRHRPTIEEIVDELPANLK